MTEKRVLVVDDQVEWQEELSHILATAGFTVDTAGSLAATVEHLNTRIYHLAIIDIRLEDWDVTNVEGMTILDELDKHYDTDALAKIMISAYGTPEQMRQAFRWHKVSDFIMKQEFDKLDFLASVREAFEKRVKINTGLDIILEDGLTFERMVVGINRAGKRVKKEDPDMPRLVIELEDLFRRLFCDYARIVVRRVTSGHGKTGVVTVAPFSSDGHDETVIVKFGDYKEIDREYRNYEEFVKGKIGMRTTNVLNLRRTPLLGGVVYSLIGTRVEQVVDLDAFYRHNSADAINASLDDLFKTTCANWYADRGVVQYCPLDKMYQTALDFEREQLIEAFEANFPYYLDQNTLTFRDLPDIHVPNPAYAIKGRTLARSTFLCTTHGDLNANNIFVDTDGHTWLIDFYRTGKSHILRDCTQLETVIKFILLPEEELAERYNLEKALMDMSRFQEADGLRYNAPNEAYTKVFKVCRKLRQLARDLVQPNDEFSEYEIGLLYCSMNTQRFYSLPKVNRLHALLAAGMLCQKLGLSA